MLSADDRQRLMVLLAVREGLRRGEIARVHSDDLIEEAGGWSLRVHGKGDKIRVVPLSDDVALELMVLPSGWAFPGQVDGHLSPEYVGKLVSRLLPDGWTTHTLRHRFATNAYAGQRDLFAVQTLLGHSSPETTRRYVHSHDDVCETFRHGFTSRWYGLRHRPPIPVAARGHHFDGVPQLAG